MTDAGHMLGRFAATLREDSSLLTEQAVLTGDNPYLNEYRRLLKHQLSHGAAMPSLGIRPQPFEYCLQCPAPSDFRHRGMCLKWSWAVPNDAALSAIMHHSPTGLIEVGAGSGYWASLLRKDGLDVLAFDPNPPPRDQQWSIRDEPFTDVTIGDHSVVVDHGDRTLFLCWPGYTADWSHEVVELYAGDTVIYVGESGGCTGSDRMHQLLGFTSDSDGDAAPGPFEIVDSVEIPQWCGLHDRLYVCQRTSVT